MKKYLFAIAAVLLSAVSCTDRLYEDGDYTSIVHIIAEPFDGVEVAGGFQLVLDPTVAPGEVEITVAENIHPYVIVRSDDGIVSISLRNGISYSALHLEARVSPMGINLLSASGGSSIESEYLLVRDRLELYLSGGSSAYLDGSANYLYTLLSGGSDASLDRFYALELEADLSGGSHECVSVVEHLRLTASGGSVLEYYGSPLRRDVNVSGGSRCENIGSL